MSLTLTRPPIAQPRALAPTTAHVAVHGDDATLAAPALSRPDIVEEWGMQSFPASDPPSNW